MTVEYYNKPTWVDGWFKEIKNDIKKLEKEKEQLLEEQMKLKEKQKLIEFTLERDITVGARLTLQNKLPVLQKEESDIINELNSKVNALTNSKDILKYLESASKEMYL